MSPPSLAFWRVSLTKRRPRWASPVSQVASSVPARLVSKSVSRSVLYPADFWILCMSEGTVLQTMPGEGFACALTWVNARSSGSQDRVDPMYIPRRSDRGQHRAEDGRSGADPAAGKKARCHGPRVTVSTRGLLPARTQRARTGSMVAAHGNTVLATGALQGMAGADQPAPTPGSRGSSPPVAEDDGSARPRGHFGWLAGGSWISFLLLALLLLLWITFAALAAYQHRWINVTGYSLVALIFLAVPTGAMKWLGGVLKGRKSADHPSRTE
jgi:hypothetical protein